MEQLGIGVSGWGSVRIGEQVGVVGYGADEGRGVVAAGERFKCSSPADRPSRSKQPSSSGTHGRELAVALQLSPPAMDPTTIRQTTYLKPAHA